MKPIRLATQSEIDSIKDHSDLEHAVSVIAWENDSGGSPDIAVIRRPWEVDPVYFAPSSNTKRRLVFGWGIDNILKLQGVPSYYFNIDAANTEWASNLEKLGCIKQSPSPEFRYKRPL